MPIGGKRLRGHDLPEPTDRSIGLLFMVGSALFGVGSFPVANRWDPRFDGAAYAVGAVFFTAAATLQFLQSLAPARPAHLLRRARPPSCPACGWSSSWPAASSWWARCGSTS